jgi:hypothetical protein
VSPLHGVNRALPAEAAWERHEQSGRPLPAVEARPQATSGSDPAKSGEPRWLHVSGEIRDRVEGRTTFNFAPGTGDGYDLTRLRLNLAVTPAPWLNFFFQAQDAQAPGIETRHLNASLKEDFDLRQAYVELAAGPARRVRFRVGRQELNIGSQRLIGSSDWGNTARSFNAAQLTVASKRAQVEVFAASVINTHPTSFGTVQAGVNLYGVYGSLHDAKRRTSIEPYVFWNTNPHVVSEEGVRGHKNLVTLGVRWTGNWSNHFDSAVEVADQTGSLSNDSIDAWAGYGIGGYTFAAAPLEPRFSAEYDYASGDQRRGDGRIGTFDQLYPSNHAPYGIADQVGWRNLRALRLGTNFTPQPKIKANFDYNWFWLASRFDGLYSSGGVQIVSAPTSGAAHTGIGQEADVVMTYAVRPELSLGAGVGSLFAGPFLKENSTGHGTVYPYAFATYRF